MFNGIVKKKSSIGIDNVVPSRDFDELEYSLYLKYATSEELEKDKVTHVIAKKIICYKK